MALDDCCIAVQLDVPVIKDICNYPFFSLDNMGWLRFMTMTFPIFDGLMLKDFLTTGVSISETLSLQCSEITEISVV